MYRVALFLRFYAYCYVALYIFPTLSLHRRRDIILLFYHRKYARIKRIYVKVVRIGALVCAVRSVGSDDKKL